MTFELDTIVCGDCLDVMHDMPSECINLIYIDPPFGIDRDKEFGMLAWKDNIQVPNRIDEVLPIHPLDIAMRNYLRWLYERLVLMRDLLAEDGSIYVHCDYRVSGYIRLVLDEVFGKQFIRNEIIWSYRRWTGSARNFLHMHDTLFFFSKGQNYIFNEQWTEYTAQSLHRKKNYHTRIKGDDVYETSINEKGVKANDVWTISVINSQADERIGYPTQKPEALLERIIKASSNEGDLVADFFCGSGTTLVVAKSLGRHFFGCDTSPRAVKLTDERILKVQLGSVVGIETDGREKRLGYEDRRLF